MAEPPRRLVLLRHGRTAWNAEGRAQGHADVELDDVGHAQAAAMAPHLAALRPVALWSSDLARARQTAAYVEKETGLTAVLDARLREYDVGERTGLTLPEFAEQFPSEYAVWVAGRDGWSGTVAGAESTDDVLARTLPAYRELLSGLGEGQTGVVVTHGACLRDSVVALLGWDRSVCRSLRGLDNCAAAVLQQAAPDGALRLAAWNARPNFTLLGDDG